MTDREMSITTHHICELCGYMIENGLMSTMEHIQKYHSTKIELRPYTDNEMRNVFMEMGMPYMGFEAFGFAKPTEMERVIFEIPEPPEEPEPPRSEEDIAFDAVFVQMTEAEQMELVILGSAGFRQGNMQVMGHDSMMRYLNFKDEMRKKYGN